LTFSYMKLHCTAFTSDSFLNQDRLSFCMYRFLDTHVRGSYKTVELRVEKKKMEICKKFLQCSLGSAMKS
jgi:hypothetical protein